MKIMETASLATVRAEAFCFCLARITLLLKMT